MIFVDCISCMIQFNLIEAKRTNWFFKFDKQIFGQKISFTFFLSFKNSRILFLALFYLLWTKHFQIFLFLLWFCWNCECTRIILNFIELEKKRTIYNEIVFTLDDIQTRVFLYLRRWTHEWIEYEFDGGKMIQFAWILTLSSLYSLFDFHLCSKLVQSLFYSDGNLSTTREYISILALCLRESLTCYRHRHMFLYERERERNRCICVNEQRIKVSISPCLFL